MAEKVILKQFKNKAKKPVAGLTPEHAVYDANGVRLDAKLGNVNLQEFRDLQQQCVNNIKAQQDSSETYINNKVDSAKSEIDTKHNEVSQLTQAAMIGANTEGLEGNNVQENLNNVSNKLIKHSEKLSELKIKTQSILKEYGIIDNKLIKADASLKNNNNWLIVEEIKCSEGDEIRWKSGYTTADYNTSLVIFNAKGEKVAYISVGNEVERIINAPEGSVYIMASIYKPSANGYIKINDAEIWNYNSIEYEKQFQDNLFNIVSQHEYSKMALISLRDTSNDLINITSSKITIPANARVEYGHSKLYTVPTAIELTRTGNYEDVVIFNDSTKTFEIHAGGNARTNDEYLIFVINRNNSISLSPSQYTINGEPVYEKYGLSKEYDINDAVLIPFVGSFVNITSSSITIPQNSRVYWGTSKVYVLRDGSVTISRNTAQNTELILFNSKTNTFRCYTSDVFVAEILKDEHIVFTVKKGIQGCSLPAGYVTYDGVDISIPPIISRVTESENHIESIGTTLLSINGVKDNYTLLYTGEDKENNDWFISPEIPCKKGDIITFYTGSKKEDYSHGVVYYDSNGGYLGYISIGDARERSMTLSDEKYNDVSYLKIPICKSSKNGYVKINGVTVFRFEGDLLNYQKALDSFIKNTIDSDKSIVTLNKEESYLIEHALRIVDEKKASKENDNILSLIHFSDLHGSTDNLKRIVEFKNRYADYINDAIHTGDTTTNFFSDRNVWNDVEGAENILNVIGNHDCWIQGQTWPYPYSATSQQVYNTIMVGTDDAKPFITNWGVEYTENLCYYYKDYSKAKIRLIVLDSLHYDNAQELWFTSILASAKASNLAVIVATHYQCMTGQDKIDLGGWNSLKYSLPNVTPTPDSQIDHRLSETAFVAVDNFINGGGEFICWLSGHTHADFIGVVNGHINQLSIVVDTAGEDYRYVEEDRTKGSKNQDSFNVVTFNTKDKIIRIVRIGCNCDMWMRSKKAFCYNYGTHEIVSYL